MSSVLKFLLKLNQYIYIFIYLTLYVATCMIRGLSMDRKFTLTVCTATLGLLCDLSQTFQLSPPGVSTHVTMRQNPAAGGGNVGEKCPGILLKCQISRYIQRTFTCRKATTWDRRLYLPSEGRRAEDFFALKFGRMRTRELGYQRPARYLQTTDAAFPFLNSKQ